MRGLRGGQIRAGEGADDRRIGVWAIVEGHDVASYATVRVAGNDVEIVAEGSAQINLLRAAAGAIWDSGRAIYGLRVPERLYDDPFRTAR